jgi:hypothetical protein
MSFILDALKKLERTRSRGPVPNRDAAYSARLESRPHWLPWTLAGIALVTAVGALVWRITASTKPEAAVVSSPVVIERVPKRAKKPAVVPSPVVVRVEPTPAPKSEAIPPAIAAPAVAVKEAVPAAPTAVQPAPKMVAPPPTLAPAPVLERKSAAPEPRVNSGATAGRPKPESDPHTKPWRPAPEALPREVAKANPVPSNDEQDEPLPGARSVTTPDTNADLPEIDVPVLEALSPEIQASVPKLKISILAYASGAADRMAYINGQKYVEGQLVDGKLKVESIVRQGVVLSIQGQRFLLRP